MVKIEELYSVLYRGPEHFSLARTFRVASEGRLACFVVFLSGYE